MRKQILDHLKSKDFDTKSIDAIIAHFDAEKTNGCSDDEALSSVISKFFKPKNQETKASINYRDCLYHSLAKESAGLNQGQLDAIFKQYDRISGIKGEKDAFTILHNTFGNETEQQAFESYATSINYRLPQSKMGKIFEDSLTEANKKTIELNPVKRIKDIVARYNKKYFSLRGDFNKS